MLARSQDDIHRIHDSLDTVKRLSDGIIKIGPLNLIGLDAILAWIPIPGLDVVYSTGAGVFILWQGIRARCDIGTLIAAFLALAFDMGLSVGDIVVPLLGPAADTLFQGQLYAAHMIQKDMEKTLYVEGSASEAHRSGQHAENLAEMRATKGKRRVVYLG